MNGNNTALVDSVELTKTVSEEENKSLVNIIALESLEAFEKGEFNLHLSSLEAVDQVKSLGYTPQHYLLFDLIPIVIKSQNIFYVGEKHIVSYHSCGAQKAIRDYVVTNVAMARKKLYDPDSSGSHGTTYNEPGSNMDRLAQNLGSMFGDNGKHKPKDKKLPSNGPYTIICCKNDVEQITGILRDLGYEKRYGKPGIDSYGPKPALRT
ncbi:hypothetical protein JXA85_06060 [Candidatus Woesearchaeota archaeon]|nr:hypothetical protein [Candidatus Woesearchaeota archaeon]